MAQALARWTFFLLQRLLMNDIHTRGREFFLKNHGQKIGWFLLNLSNDVKNNLESESGDLA